MEAMSAVILCGGHSRRMGRDKAGLAWGDGTLLDTLLRALSGLDEVYLSADCAERYPFHACRVVEDQYPDSGPLGGLCSALPACRTPLLFAVACDMPLVTGAVAAALRERITPHVRPLPPDSSSRSDPAAAIRRFPPEERSEPPGHALYSRLGTAGRGDGPDQPQYTWGICSAYKKQRM